MPDNNAHWLCVDALVFFFSSIVVHLLNMIILVEKNFCVEIQVHLHNILDGASSYYLLPD